MEGTATKTNVLRLIYEFTKTSWLHLLTYLTTSALLKLGQSYSVKTGEIH